MPSPRVELAPHVTFATFGRQQVQRNAEAIKPDGTMEGIHQLFVGMTGSGKTTLNRILLRMKRTSLVFGTKPGRDTSLEKYIEEGYLRIDHWPPTKKELKTRGPRGQLKLLLWPEIKQYGELRGHRPTFERALHDIAVEGNWTVSIDEGLWVCSTKGLNLGDAVTEIAYGGRSNGVSLHVVVQRPSGIPVIVHSMCQDNFIGKIGNDNDIRTLAGYGDQSTRSVNDTIRGLNKGNPTKGHEFLYLPTSGGATWCVSEVPEKWA